MPVHDHKCKLCGSIVERFVAVADLDKPQHHNEGCAGGLLERVFLVAPAGFVSRDIHYDSPVDGRPITTKHARQEDLRRHGCIEWEPGMKEHFARERQAAEAKLEASFDQTVEAAFEVMDTRKREKLAQELHAGANVEVERSAPDLSIN